MSWLRLMHYISSDNYPGPVTSTTVKEVSQIYLFLSHIGGKKFTLQILSQVKTQWPKPAPNWELLSDLPSLFCQAF